jgi:Zn-dependent protease
MTQVFVTPVCERCGQTVPPYANVCVRCGALVHRAELERLSREALELEPHDPAGAAMRWRRCLDLLPPDAQQYAQIYHRLVALTAPPAGSGPAAHPLGYAPPAAAGPRDDSPASALLKTGGSMLISILVYALLLYRGGSPVLALQFATGFVVLILIHELGHVAAMRHYGLSASPPIFIPFMGALINLRQPPQDAKVEAVVGIGGPIAGTVGALMCYGLYHVLPEGSAQWLTYRLAFVGFALNLFNLLPVPPLDGGRITAAINPKVWMLGMAGLVAWIAKRFLVDHETPVLLLLVLFFALPRVRATLARRNTADPYYAISRVSRWTIGVLYVGLGLVLLAGFLLTRDAFRLT